MRRMVWLSGFMLVLTLGAAISYWVGQNLIEKTVYGRTDYQGKARHNWLYAAQRLLERLGTPVQSVSNFSDLPQNLGSMDTVLLTTGRYRITQGRAESLLRWVAAGGHLVFTVYQPYAKQRPSDPLLDRLPVAVEEKNLKTSQRVGLQYGSPPRKLDLVLGSNLRLHDIRSKAIWKAADADGAYLLQYSWGDGLITIVSDLTLFGNARLGDQDHADLLWLLLGNPERKGTVWLQYVRQIPSLLGLLWELAWMPLLGVMVTIITALWAASYRFGPCLIPATHSQRSLREHLQASGRFLWRQGAQADLLSATRQRTLGRLKRCFPHWQRLSTETQVTCIAERTGLTSAQVARALQESPSALNEREFTQRIHTLQDMENHL